MPMPGKLTVIFNKITVYRKKFQLMSSTRISAKRLA